MEEAEDARPQCVVGQLPPPALVQYRPAVNAASNEVHQAGNDGDHAKNSAGR